jgi:RNA polymerase sigma-70 factor (ECF subfamily)
VGRHGSASIHARQSGKRARQLDNGACVRPATSFQDASDFKHLAYGTEVAEVTSMRSARKQFESLALPHLHELYAVAMRYTRNPDDAQDLVQETFLRAYLAWSSFLPGSNCRAWLLRILTNGFINHYRKGRSRKAFAARSEAEHVALLHDEKENAEEAMASHGLGDEVTRALDALDEDYRVVVVLADLEGLRYKDIAQILDCPVGTVMSRLFRARRQLEEKLAAYARADYGIARAA